MNSNLQIISGRYRGRKLNLPKSARPTQNLGRIALFNMLESLNVKPNNVWDVFAGSGAFGIECLSRYDSKVVFTDTSAESIKTIKSNLSDVTGNFQIEQIDAMTVIKKYGSNADLVFIDPPYAKNQLGVDFVNKFATIGKSGTILIWEIEDAVVNPIIPAEYDVLRNKKYGRARFLILKKA